jgi:cobalt-zinc-cadmium efflux system membrane fusion protein
METPAHDAAADNLVRIAPEMRRDLRVTTAPAVQHAGGEGVTALGELRVDDDAYAEVGTPIAARVAKVLVGLGDTVAAGQPLVELQSVELGKARGDFLTARARAELAQQALERKRGLNAERIVPRRELQEAEAEAAAAAAGLRAARAALQAIGVSPDDAVEAKDAEPARLVLRAPIAGTVIERNAVQGQAIDPARPLFRIADLSELWLIVQAFERDALQVQVGGDAHISFPALPGRSFSGMVRLVASQVDASSRTIPIRVVVTNPDGVLRPGMSATVWLPLGEPSGDVVAVPAPALQRLREGWCVFLPRGEGTFEIRPVGRGRDLSGDVEVVAGLRPGETVVVDGAFLLKAEADKARGGGEHED